MFCFHVIVQVILSWSLQRAMCHGTLVSETGLSLQENIQDIYFLRQTWLILYCFGNCVSIASSQGSLIEWTAHSSGIEWQGLGKSCFLIGMDKFVVFFGHAEGSFFKEAHFFGKFMVLFNQLAFE